VRRDDIDCERGGNQEAHWYLSIVLFAGSVLSSFLVTFVCMVLLYRGVRNTEIKLRQYGHGSTRGENLELSRMVGVQGLYYIGSFVVAYGFTLVVSLLVPHFATDKSNRNIYFPLCFLSSLTTPLQGFLNAVVFFHGRWKRLSAPDRAMHHVHQWSKALSSEFFATRSPSNPLKPESNANSSSSGQNNENGRHHGTDSKSWPSAAAYRSIRDDSVEEENIDQMPPFVGLGRNSGPSGLVTSSITAPDLMDSEESASCTIADASNSATPTQQYDEDLEIQHSSQILPNNDLAGIDEVNDEPLSSL